MNDDTRVWGIHTQDDKLFLNDNKIAIGWRDFGNLSKLEATREAFKERYIEAYPDAKKGSIPTSSGMLFRFIHEVQIGDYVVFPSKSDRKINIGVIESNYNYVPDANEYVQQRSVKWLKHLPRTFFSQGALYEIGSAMSFFAVKKYAKSMQMNFLQHWTRISRRTYQRMMRRMKVLRQRQMILLSPPEILYSRNSVKISKDMLWKSLWQICCVQWGTGQQCHLMEETAALILRHIRMNCRRVYWCR